MTALGGKAGILIFKPHTIAHTQVTTGDCSSAIRFWHGGVATRLMTDGGCLGADAAGGSPVISECSDDDAQHWSMSRKGAYYVSVNECLSTCKGL